jgi:hypothetical protein
MTVKSLRKQLAAAIAMTLVATVALGSSTYAWFVNNAQVTAASVNVNAATAYNLLIATDDDHAVWGTYGPLNSDVFALTPVSTIGAYFTEDEDGKVLTAADPENEVAKVGYGDGETVEQYDVEFVRMSQWTNSYASAFEEVAKTSVISDEEDAPTFFYSDVLYLKAAQDAKIFLDSDGTGISYKTIVNGAVTAEASFMNWSDFFALDATIDEENDSQAVKDYKAQLAQDQAFARTLRVGFLVTTDYDDLYADTTKATTRTWFEYQLDTNYILDENDSTASSVNTTISSEGGANGITTAVNAIDTGIGGAVANINSAAVLTSKTIDDYCIDGESTAIADASSAPAGSVLATVLANEVVKVDVYVWMEGCDYDTVAAHVSRFSAANVQAMQFGFCLGATE